MRVIVCIKAVPESTEIRINPETNTLIREEMELIINPFDTYAIEEGLRLVEAHGGTVTVMTMGPPSTRQQLVDALALGCDEAVLLSGPEFAGADTWATAYTLARAIARLGEFDLILCGKQAIDGDTGQVGPGIANQLGIPQLTYVSAIREIVPDEHTITVERLLEEGREIVRGRLPALLTVLKDINQPRYPTPRGLRKARRKKVPVWSAADLEADARYLGLQGSPTKVVTISTPPLREGEVVFIEGENVEQQADILSDRLIEAKLV